ncbi:hypothetical protein U1Q18_038656 [Sarracenia purpurea var. burkii]
MSEQSAVSEEPRIEVSEPVKPQQHPSESNNFGEYLSPKNRLQEYTQKSGLPFPKYQTTNEGDQRGPRFKSSVLVDKSWYTTPVTFPNRKAAEQDAARVALCDVTQKIKDEGCALIHKDTTFCKSILNEYAVKMNLDKPTYTTTQSEGMLPVFISSLVFNGVTYTGEAGRNKKEAEQLAAKDVILSILGISGSGSVIVEIIMTKFKLYAALHKVEGSNNGPNCTDDMQITAIPKTSSGEQDNIPASNQPYHELKKPKLVLSSEASTPTNVSVPPVSSAKKRNLRNREKKKAKKKAQVITAQLPVAMVL